MLKLFWDFIMVTIIFNFYSPHSWLKMPSRICCWRTCMWKTLSSWRLFRWRSTGRRVQRRNLFFWRRKWSPLISCYVKLPQHPSQLRLVSLHYETLFVVLDCEVPPASALWSFGAKHVFVKAILVLKWKHR